MKYRVISYLLFAVFMFTIPLVAMGSSLPVMAPADNFSQQERQELKSDVPVAQPAALEQFDSNHEGFRLRDKRTGKIFEVSTRDFVRGSLAAEMPPTFHPEALKAQAVASHTYALYVKHMNQSEDQEDLAVNVQNWEGYVTEELFRERYGEYADHYWKAICDAADEVSGYLVVYEDEPIIAAYHSMSSGTTEDAGNVWEGSVPYLTPVESRGDILAPDYNKKQEFTMDEVADALEEAFPGVSLGEDPSVWIQTEDRSAGGYVLSAQVGDQTVLGTELRAALGLRSSNFEVSYSGGSFTFAVKGYGHGVGLSQYGADYLARQGMSFDEILLHYYTGAKLARVSG